LIFRRWIMYRLLHYSFHSEAFSLPIQTETLPGYCALTLSARETPSIPV
jgi:hypothetical protein